MLSSITGIPSDCTLTLHLAMNQSGDLCQCRARQRACAQPPNTLLFFTLENPDAFLATQKDNAEIHLANS